MIHALKNRKQSSEHIRLRTEAVRKAHKEGKYNIPICPKCKTFVGKTHNCEKIREKQREAKLKNPTRFWLGKKGSESSRWEGGGWKWWHKDARKKMEKHLNRKLKTYEVVHHINGNWKDNSIKNLQIVTQSEHMKIHWDERRNDIKKEVYKWKRKK